jgi:hypothetical protein
VTNLFIKIYFFISVFIMVVEVRSINGVENGPNSEINVVSNIEEDRVAEAMREKINELNLFRQSFTCVDLGLTNAELALVDELKFNKISPDSTSQYDRFGNLYLLKDELPIFLSHIGDNNEEVIQAVTQMISSTVAHVIKATEKATAWVCVRVSTPMHAFDMPRWHTDGMYYGLNDPYLSSEPVLKFAAVLKGSPTLLLKLSDDMRNIFNLNRNNRALLAELLDINKAESPKRGEGVFFVVADNKISAVHSEPRMNENRLFFSILVGNESEINELYSRWHS